jgi:hypothetical protein
LFQDEKIENYLGHLQKEFVGGELSAEHLGKMKEINHSRCLLLPSPDVFQLCEIT